MTGTRLRISKWLGLDVPSRLKRKTGLDVHHVVGRPVTIGH